MARILVLCSLPRTNPGNRLQYKRQNSPFTLYMVAGWLKEFVLTPYMGDRLVPDSDELKERMLKYLNYMSSKSVTTLWDAGNFNMDDAVYQVAHDIAREGNLPLRWEGSYHIWAPDQIDIATESLLRLRERYSHGIDLHLHAAGDRATRNILDAVEQARGALGRPLGIEVTLSHLFSVADSDIERFPELNVHANFTSHWFGGTVFGDARQINVGPERAGRSQLVGHFVRRQASVTLSSDVVHNPRRVNPFIGIEMSITRKAIDRAAAALPPLDAGISLEQARAAYTVNGAAQLGLEEEIGAIKADLLADFIVLAKNPFETDVERIHAIEASATIVAGELRSGSL